MILKRYGTSYQSVETNFNCRAHTEIAFRRDPAFSVPTEEFVATYERVGERVLSPETEGDVQDAAEEALLKALDAGIAEALAALEDGQLLVMESRETNDYPKTWHKKRNVVVDGENRLYFYWEVRPPLRLGVFQKKG
jgi:hypothetical protein